VIAITKTDDRLSEIRQFNLMTHELTFQENIEGTYIKCNQVQQNNRGDKYSVCYLDDGHFWLRVFDKEARIKEVNLN
jgi:hypothetical protein